MSTMSVSSEFSICHLENFHKCQLLVTTQHGTLVKWQLVSIAAGLHEENRYSQWASATERRSVALVFEPWTKKKRKTCIFLRNLKVGPLGWDGSNVFPNLVSNQHSNLFETNGTSWFRQQSVCSIALFSSKLWLELKVASGWGLASCSSYQWSGPFPASSSLILLTHTHTHT